MPTRAVLDWVEIQMFTYLLHAICIAYIYTRQLHLCPPNLVEIQSQYCQMMHMQMTHPLFMHKTVGRPICVEAPKNAVNESYSINKSRTMPIPTPRVLCHAKVGERSCYETHRTFAYAIPCLQRSMLALCCGFSGGPIPIASYAGAAGAYTFMGMCMPPIPVPICDG